MQQRSSNKITSWLNKKFKDIIKETKPQKTMNIINKQENYTSIRNSAHMKSANISMGSVPTDRK